MTQSTLLWEIKDFFLIVYVVMPFFSNLFISLLKFTIALPLSLIMFP